MDEIVYRKINRDEAEIAAEIHVRIPLYWDPDFVIYPEFTEKLIKEILEKIRVPDVLLLGAFVDEKMTGFHWLQLKDQPQGKIAKINSLWVDPAYRKKGVALKLKSMGEEWAQEKGAVEISTHVNTVNAKMIALNKTLGFEIEKFVMKKKLKG